MKSKLERFWAKSKYFCVLTTPPFLPSSAVKKDQRFWISKTRRKKTQIWDSSYVGWELWALTFGFRFVQTCGFEEFSLKTWLPKNFKNKTDCSCLFLEWIVSNQCEICISCLRLTYSRSSKLKAIDANLHWLVTIHEVYLQSNRTLLKTQAGRS